MPPAPDDRIPAADRAPSGAAPDATAPRPAPTASTSVWRACLGDAILAGGAVPWLAAGALDHLGDPDGERVDLLAGRPVVVPRFAVGHLRLTGSDRVAFAHGLVSADVAGLPEGGAVEALLLDHRGQPQAGLVVVRRRDDLFVAVDDGAGETVRATFVAHVVFDRVEVEALDDRLVTATFVEGAGGGAGPGGPGDAPTTGATLVGAALESSWPGAAAALTGAIAALASTGGERGRGVAAPDDAASTGVAPASVVTAGGRALLRPRPFGPGWAVDVHALADDVAAAWPRWLAAGVRPVGERAWTAGRVAHGVASALGEGRLGLPQETGLEGRISYRKGCYLGQEIMARIEARGRVRRALRSVVLEGPPPGLGSARGWRLEDASGRAVGALGSAAPAFDGIGWGALAVVRLDVPDDGGWRVVVDGAAPLSGPSATSARPRVEG